jgi:aerotaxis receptor
MKKNLPVTDREITFGQDERIISTTDLKGIITSVNDTFVKISGFSREELIGFNHNLVRHPDMPPLAFENLWNTIKAGKPWIGLVKNRCKNGDFYWVHAYVSPIFEEDRIVGYQSVRYPPSQDQIQRAAKLYKRINRNGGTFGLLGNLEIRFNYTFLIITILLFLLMSSTGVAIASNGISWLQGLIAMVIGLPLMGLISFFATRPLRRLHETSKQIADNSVMEFLYSRNGQEAASAEHALLMLQSKLNTAVGRLHHFSGFLCNAADKSSASTKLSQENVQRLESEVEQVATAIEEMSATIEEIARSATTTAEMTQGTKSQMDQGNLALQHTCDEIDDLGKQVERTGEVISQLSSDFRSVDSVLHFIEEISGQTNLLALNAAIEAARAGEHGRGFAVVADQVRLLANQTMESTSNIKSLLEKLDNDINHLSSDMHSSRGQMQQVLERISNLRQDLSDTQHSLAQVTEMNTGIASAVQEQHMVVSEVNRSIHNIGEISTQTAEIANDSATAAEALKSNAKSLNVLIKQVTS